MKICTKIKDLVDILSFFSLWFGDTPIAEVSPAEMKLLIALSMR